MPRLHPLYAFTTSYCVKGIHLPCVSAYFDSSPRLNYNRTSLCLLPQPQLFPMTTPHKKPQISESSHNSVQCHIFHFPCSIFLATLRYYPTLPARRASCDTSEASINRRQDAIPDMRRESCHVYSSLLNWVANGTRTTICFKKLDNSILYP